MFSKQNKGLLNAWISYDWANSVYFLVITSTVFPLYYGAICGDTTYLDIFGYSIKNTALISFVTAAAFMVVALFSPLLSGIADYTGNKKRFMQFFCYLGALSCVGLYWFEIETIYAGLFFYFFALIGAWSSLVFYNSYLPDIASAEQMDRTSARGYAMGYIGSVLLLLLNLMMILSPNSFGITGTTEQAALKAMKYAFIAVGVWWFGFSQIAFFYLPRGNKENVLTKALFFNGYKEMRSVWKSLSHHPTLKRYLGAFFVFSMALQTVMLVAAYFGEQEVQWAEGQKTMGLIISILAIQIIAIFGALVTARLSKRFGNIKMLIALNFFWVVLCVLAYFVYTPIQFYITAGLVGLSMGGIQALARSTYSKLIPRTADTASYFSFYDVAEKLGIVIGMLMYGFVDQITGSMRNSILFFLIFFLIGALLLRRLNKKEPNLLMATTKGV